jgi:hypothetical protein
VFNAVAQKFAISNFVKTLVIFIGVVAAVALLGLVFYHASKFYSHVVLFCENMVGLVMWVCGLFRKRNEQPNDGSAREPSRECDIELRPLDIAAVIRLRPPSRDEIDTFVDFSNPYRKNTPRSQISRPPLAHVRAGNRSSTIRGKHPVAEEAGKADATITKHGGHGHVLEQTGDTDSHAANRIRANSKTAIRRWQEPW